MRRSWGPWGLLVLVAIVYAIYVMLSSPHKLTTPYGYSYSHQGTKSINGVAAFRKMYDLRGWESRTLKRLSRSAGRLDAIVWFPDADQVPSMEATRWLDQWLAEAPRTLVYVVRGLRSTESRYWQQALSDGAPDQRLEYRRRQVRALTAAAEPTFGTVAAPAVTSYSNGWFTADFHPHYTTAKDFSGPWADQIDPLPQRLTTRATIRPFDIDTDSQFSTGTFRSETVDEDDPPSVELEPLLRSADDDIVAARLTSEMWPDSQVLVLCSGECLMNLSLSDSVNRVFADHLVQLSGSPGEIGFLRTDLMGARVGSDSDDDLAAGMELLTQWPLSMTTMHVVLLGFVAILALLPIFGRPRRLPPPPTGDFGEHVAAVAELLQRSGDTDYARQRISEYFVQVRGEESGPWVLPAASNAYEKPKGEAP
ncbi:hypothetical protein [Rosistilla oblonga]|uniref:hypothetical protein n=1 Tax=Rosistilla oblonga TaxID=2527990 RepID=UPI003A97CC3B